MRRLKTRLGVALIAGLALGAAWFTPGLRAASLPLIPSTSQYSEPSQIVATLNFLVQQINSLITPQTMAQLSTPRNVLDNGGMFVSQRGTGTATCANNGSAIASANYAADRWGCEVNVGSGAGQLTPITATPSPPTGFTTSLKLVRNSGALLQPQCAYQEVPQYKIVGLQGQNVVFAVNIQALAGLAADQGASTQTANLVIITGTGTDQGFGTWTASPAITPAWTGVATLINTSVSLPVTPAWTRYSTTALVPTTVNEIAVAVCFTPTATGAGATDGIAFTGAQLEPGTSPSAFEYRSPGAELAELQRYFWQLNSVSGAFQASGACTATNVDTLPIPLPVQMRTAPTAAVTAGAWQLVINGAAAAGISGQGVGTSTINNVTLTATNACTAGQTVELTSNGTTGVITASSDF